MATILKETPKKDCGFAFKYLRADRQGVEVGPFLGQDEAEKARGTMKHAGAVVTEVYPVDGDAEKLAILKAQSEGYVKGLIKAFKSYLRKELDVLKDDKINYDIVYEYLKELKVRVRRYVKSNDPSLKEMSKDELVRKFARCGKAYRKGVAVALLKTAEHYSPIDGSVSEDIGETLVKLSREFSETKKR
jgi:hypothetical protein